MDGYVHGTLFTWKSSNKWIKNGMGGRYQYEWCLMECRWLDDSIMDVSVATYGHATVDGIDLKCT